jgi:bifunctional DNA-binding transcriptional regulator/antitoxin component of YhaV-PrlF toxin-antitoxin module
MLAKLTSKNQLTLPKALMSLFPGTQYFEVAEEGGKIVLTPLNLQRGDAVRAKLTELGIEAKDVRDAIRWARSGK